MPAISKKSGLRALVLFALIVYIYQKRGVFLQMLTVFIFAAAFTLILAPLCARLERKGMPSSAAAAVSVSCFVLAALLIVSAFVPYLITHSIELLRRITPTLTEVIQNVGGLLAQFGLQMQEQKGIADMITGMMSRLTALLARGGVAFATQAGQIAFSLVIAYYLLCERVSVSSHLMLCLPITWRTAFLSAMLGCRNAVLGYLSGVLKTSLFVFLATFAGLFALGVRDALLLSLFMGIFEVLPYIGPVLASVPIILTTLPQGFNQALLATALVVLVQQVEGNFISPYFTASSTSIHPLAALVSVFVLGSLMGLWGILLAVPLVVTLRSVLWSVRQASGAMNRA